ncbi:MAG: glycosyltransferase family 4 protein [Candidatus Nanopelagicales bacterium]
MTAAMPHEGGVDGTYRLTLISDSDQAWGAELFLATLAAALPAEVMVSVIAPAVVRDCIEKGRQLARRGRYIKSVKALRAELRVQLPDVVLVNATHPRSCRRALVAARSLGIPTVIVDHSQYQVLTSSGRIAQQLISRTAARRIAVGSGTASALEHSIGLEPGAIEVVLNGTPECPACPPRVRDGRVILGTLGRLSQEKGLPTLLAAMPALPGRFVLKIAGTGPDSEALASAVQAAGLVNRVDFVGYCVDVRSFMCGIDVFVQPSYSEGLPLTVVEAMFCARPVVASDVGSISDIIDDGVTGWLVPPRQPQALADALLLVGDDPGLAATTAIAARTLATRELSDQRMATRYDEIFRAVLRDATAVASP